MSEVSDSRRPTTPASRRKTAAGKTQRIEANVVRQAGDWSSLEPVEPLIEACLPLITQRAALPHDHCEVAIALLDDAEVRALNKKFRGHDKTTNVLSFPAHISGPATLDSGEPSFLGDIALAAETVTREATDFGIPQAHHFQHLVIHGILHILGFDHEDGQTAETMETLETELLAKLGVADPYVAPLQHSDST